MANGDVVETANTYRHVKLLDAIGATSNGQWISTFGYNQISVVVSGITSATVELDASNDATIPDNTDHGISRGQLTADGEFIFDVLPRWIKARIPTWVSGTVSAIAVLRRTGGMVAR